MSIKTLVADTGTKEDKEAWNDAVRAVKGKKTGTSDGYRDLLTTSDKAAKDAVERANARVPVADGVAAADDFVSMAEHYRGKNPSEAAATLAEARNKGGK
jgi:cell wall-associated NlpC family hydrolase